MYEITKILIFSAERGVNYIIHFEFNAVVRTADTIYE